jgi:hypothetical protein
MAAKSTDVKVTPSQSRAGIVKISPMQTQAAPRTVKSIKHGVESKNVCPMGALCDQLESCKDAHPNAMPGNICKNARFCCNGSIQTCDHETCAFNHFTTEKKYLEFRKRLTAGRQKKNNRRDEREYDDESAPRGRRTIVLDTEVQTKPRPITIYDACVKPATGPKLNRSWADTVDANELTSQEANDIANNVNSASSE